MFGELYEKYFKEYKGKLPTNEIVNVMNKAKDIDENDICLQAIVCTMTGSSFELPEKELFYDKIMVFG